MVIPLDDYNWYPQQTDLVIIEKELQVYLINYVVILLVETHVTLPSVKCIYGLGLNSCNVPRSEKSLSLHEIAPVSQ